jgi:hypothetical protein
MAWTTFALVALLAYCFFQVNSLSVTGLRTNSLQNPMGVSTTTPRFSWWSTSAQRADTQIAYQIQVASSSSGLSSPDMWDTGKITSSDISTVYGGSALSSRKIGFWRIRVWDSSDIASSWSSIATFEMGLYLHQTGLLRGLPTTTMYQGPTLCQYLQRLSRLKAPALSQKLDCTYSDLVSMQL